jgi:hypothetical protein
VAGGALSLAQRAGPAQRAGGRLLHAPLRQGRGPRHGHRAQARALAPLRPGALVLDVCTGLGYTGVRGGAARRARDRP